MKLKSKRHAHIICIILFITVLFAICNCVKAEEVEETEETEYQSVIYNNDDGLGSAEANAIAQTNDGYIWIGSYAGLTRYDGSKFEMMDIDDLVYSVTQLFVDSKGRLWVGTNDNGVIVINTDGSYVHYTKDEGLDASSIRSFAEDSDGNILIGTTGCTAMIYAENEMIVSSVYTDYTCVVSMVVDNDNRVICVTNDGQFFVGRNNHVLFCFSDETSLGNYESVYENGEDCYIGTTDGRVISFNVTDDGIYNKKTRDIASHEGIREIVIDSHDQMWLCTDDGICYYDENDKLIEYTNSEFNNSIEMMFEDYEGNYWFASSRQGVMKLTQNSFIDMYTRLGWSPDVVNSTIVYNNKLYIGTDNGLKIVDLTSGEEVKSTISTLLMDKRIRNIYLDSSNNIWFSTYTSDGLVVLKKNGDIKYLNKDNSDVTSDFFRFAFELSDGRIFAATNDGINILKDFDINTTIGVADGLETSQILCAVETADGSILAGSDGGGIYVIQDDKVMDIIDDENGLASLIILRIVPYKGGYFLVTSSSLCYMDKYYNVKQLNNFPYTNNFDVIIRETGNMWVLSSAGIYVADIDDVIQDEEEYNYQIFNSKKGLNASLTANSWNYVSDDEDVYLSTSSGVWKVNMNETLTYSGIYKISVSINEDEQQKRVVTSNEVFFIDPDTTRVTITPKVLNYALDEPMIEYYVEGFDKKSIYVLQDDLESISYTNLSSGKYVFHINIINSATGEYIQKNTFIFEKKARFWEHLYFKIYVFSVCALVIAFISWSLTKLGSIDVIKNQYIEIERARDEAEKANRSKSIFLANMSHEIRTPINTILGMDEMILRESSESDIVEYADNIQNAGNTLLNLINDILDFSKIESGKMDIVNVDFVLEDVIRDVYNLAKFRINEKGLEFTRYFDPTIPNHLYGDEMRLKQITINLLTNAAKYTRRGSVNVDIGWENLGEDTLYLKCSVKDTGIGIRPDEKEKLFRSFQRLDEKENRNIQGTGLGLNISYSLVQMMDGDISVESEYGKGSTFSFKVKLKYYPGDTIGEIHLEKHNDKNKKVYHESFTAPNAKILAVDDNVMNLKVIKGLLKNTLVQLDTALSGMECLELMHKKEYDLVFMDHMMPIMDGIETYNEIRRFNTSVPVIVLTANAVTGAKKTYLNYGFVDYLSKPISSVALERKMKLHLPEELIINSKQSDESDDYTDLQQSRMDYNTDMRFRNIGIDFNKALEYAPGGEEGVYELMKIYIQESDKQGEKLEKYMQNLDIKEYTVLVHGIKSTSLLIGAVDLSEFARSLEIAGKDGDVEYINSNSEKFYNRYKTLCMRLSEQLITQNESTIDRKSIDEEQYSSILEEIASAADSMNSSILKDKISELENSDVDKFDKLNVVVQIREAYDKFEYDDIISVINEAKQG